MGELEEDGIEWQPTDILGKSQRKKNMQRTVTATFSDENGQVLVDEVKVNKGRKGQFIGLYIWGHSKARPGHAAYSEEATEDDLEIMMKEVRRCMKRLKMRKALGVCGVIPEMLKAKGEVVVKWLMFYMVWRIGVALTDWKKAQITPMYKNGSRLECSNYRGIYTPFECGWKGVCKSIYY